MVDAFGGSRVKVKPPERGVFALDHDGECKNMMKDYLECLRNNKSDHFPCRQLSKGYLQCRMDKNLMAKEDFSTLGLSEENPSYVRIESELGKKEKEGFVSGLGVKTKPWFK